MWRPRLVKETAPSALHRHTQPMGVLAVTHVVDGILQEQDSVLQGVADVIFRVAGRGDLFIKRTFHQLLVLQPIGRLVSCHWSLMPDIGETSP